MGVGTSRPRVSRLPFRDRRRLTSSRLGRTGRISSEPAAQIRLAHCRSQGRRSGEAFHRASLSAARGDPKMDGGQPNVALVPVESSPISTRNSRILSHVTGCIKHLIRETANFPHANSCLQLTSSLLLSSNHELSGLSVDCIAVLARFLTCRNGNGKTDSTD